MFKELRNFLSITRPTSSRKRPRKSTKHSFEALEPRKMLATISVHASGETGDEAFNLIINNQLVETFHNVGGNPEAREFQVFDYVTDGHVTADQVQVEFINDLSEGDYDRNLLVDCIVIDGTGYQAEADTTYSTGYMLNGEFTGAGFLETELLNVNGTFSFTQDNGKSEPGTRIRIDAFGDTGDENLQLQINGETVRNFSFSAAPDVTESFFYISDEIVDIDDIRIRFTNDFYDPDTGEDRNLTVLNYQAIDLESGDREIALPTNKNVFSYGVYTEADGIKAGYGRGNTLSTYGFFEVREIETYRFDRHIAGDAYLTKVDKDSGNTISVFGKNNGSLVGDRITMFDSNGDRVTSFGNNGTVVWTDVAHVAGWNKTRLDDIDFMADGSVVFTALRTPGEGRRNLPFVLKLDNSGNVDDSFTLNGLVTQTPIGSFDKITTLTEADGHITLIGGTANENVSISMSHYDEFGNLDKSYGNNGHFTINDDVIDGFTGLGGGLVDAVALPDDSIIISASTNFYRGNQPWLIKVRSDGAVDRSFGENGVMNFMPTSRMEVDSEGRILVKGGRVTVRLMANGEFDSNFGVNGFAILEQPDFRATSSFVDSENRIVVIGNLLSEETIPTVIGTSIVRLTENGDLDRTFSGDGRHDYSNFEVGSATGLDANDNLIVELGKVGTDNFSLKRLRLV